jgi:hypothetical protein
VSFIYLVSSDEFLKLLSSFLEDGLMPVYCPYCWAVDPWEWYSNLEHEQPKALFCLSFRMVSASSILSGSTSHLNDLEVRARLTSARRFDEGVFAKLNVCTT